MHTSTFDIPKSRTKLQGVEHTRKRQMFVPFQKKGKIQNDTTLLGRIVCLCKYKQTCETNYYTMIFFSLSVLGEIIVG